MRKMNWGVLGTGAVAFEFAKALTQVSGAEACAVYSRTYKKALQFSDHFRFKRVHKHLESFLEDPQLDVIYIATPNHLHCEQAIKCLKAGKHVLIEKPFALDVSQAKKIAETARQNSRFCMEAMWARFMPVYMDVKQQVQESAIGEIRFFSGSLGMAMPYDPKSRLYNLQAGGGCLLDLGIYPISLTLMLLGEPEQVAGICRKAETGADTLDRITLTYGNGAIADLQCSFECRLPNRIWISGTKGHIDIPGPVYRPNRYRLETYPAMAMEPNPGPSASLKEKLQNLPVIPEFIQKARRWVDPLRESQQYKWLPYQGNGYQYEILEVMRALENGETESGIMPLSHSIAALKITDQLRSEWNIDFFKPSKKAEYL